MRSMVLNEHLPIENLIAAILFHLSKCPPEHTAPKIEISLLNVHHICLTVRHCESQTRHHLNSARPLVLYPSKHVEDCGFLRPKVNKLHNRKIEHMSDRNTKNP